GYFATKHVEYVDIEMSAYHEKIYRTFEEYEEKIIAKFGGSSYKSQTRQACNFVFPQTDQDTREKLRSGLSKYKISEDDPEKLLSEKNYLSATDEFVDKFDKYLENIDKEDIKNGRTIINDLESFAQNYKSFMDFYKDKTKKSNLFKVLSDCST